MLVFGIFLAGFIASAAAAQGELKITDAIRMAAAAEPLVLIEKKNIESRELELQTLREEVYPDLGLSFDSNGVDGGSGSIVLTVTQVLFDWGLLQSEIEAATQEKVIATTFLKTELENVALDIGTLFIQSQYTSDRIKETELFIEKIAQINTQVMQRAQTGVGDNAEVARAMLELSRAQDLLERLRRDQEILLTQIAFRIGQDVSKISNPPSLNLTQRYRTRAEIEATVLQSPDIVQARAVRASSEANLKRVKAARLPTIQLRAQARRDVGIGRTRSSIGISTDLNLNAGNFGRRAIDLAEAELAASELSVQSIKKKQIFQFETSLKEINAVAQELLAKDAQMKTAEQVIENYEKQFQIGQRELIDLLNTQRDLYDAKIDSISLREEAKQTEYEITASIGALGSLVAAVDR